MGPLQDDAVIALGKLGDKQSARDVCGTAANGAEERATGDRRGDLPAWRELPVASRISDRDLQIRHRSDRVSGTGARCGLRTGGPGGQRESRRGHHPDRAGHAEPRSGAGRHRAGAGDSCAPQHTAAAAGAREAEGSRRRPRTSCAKPSTCSRKTSRRSGSSLTCAGPTGRRRRARRRARPPRR